MANTEQLILRGTRASRILNDPELMAFMEDLKGDLLSAIGLTQPDKPAEREVLYFQYSGLVSLQQYLSQAASVAEGAQEPDGTQTEID